MTRMYLAATSIPREIQQFRSWVVWQMREQPEGKPAKVPVTPGGSPCDANSPAHWMDYSTAATEVLCRNDLSGIGLCPRGATSAKGKLVLLDFDGVVDPSTHEVLPEVAHLLDHWRLPAEFSPSGAGLRAFAFIPPDHPWCQQKKAYRYMVHADTGRTLGQVFIHGGYCTVTGHRCNEYEEVPLLRTPEQIITLSTSTAPSHVEWRHLPEDAPPLDGTGLEGDLEALFLEELPPGERSEHVLPTLATLAAQCATEAELADRAWSTEGLRSYWMSKRERSVEAAMDLALRECAMAWALRRPRPQDEFEPVAPVVPDGTGGRLVELWSDIRPSIGRPALVKGLLDHGAMSVWYGESNAGKSAVVLDLSCHIALGWDWQGHRVVQSAVLYVAAEGPETIRRRIEAFRRRHCDKVGQDVPFAILPHAVDLVHGSDGVKVIAAAVKEVVRVTGVPVGLIVIDTLSRTLAGGDENSNVDMGSAVKRADQIRVATSAHVLIVHHAGKDRARGARGHSLLRAATDTELEVEPGLIRVTKQRDYPTGATYGFGLDAVEVGVDDDGDVITAPVVRSRQASPYEEFGVVLSDRAMAFLKVLDGQPQLDEGAPGLPEKEIRALFQDAAGQKSHRMEWKRVREEILEAEIFTEKRGIWARNEVL